MTYILSDVIYVQLILIAPSATLISRATTKKKERKKKKAVTDGMQLEILPYKILQGYECKRPFFTA